MNVAIIPARGASKRIPKKNIKDFNGKPIIAYSIEAAIDSGCFDQIVVSTDDLEIANIAKQYGAQVPFIRPKNIADDYATTASVILHAINYFEQNKTYFDYICCIYATAPFIRAQDICDTYNLLSNNDNANYCFPVCEFAFPIQRSIKLNDDNYVQMFNPEHFNTRSQDLENSYHDVGQFYWGKAKAYKDNIPVFSETSIGFPISRKRVIDLDTPEDWDYALMLLQINQK